MLCACVHVGDVVCVEGEMDDNGYYRASFGGHTGLLPANFIQETEVVNQMTRERLVNQVCMSYCAHLLYYESVSRQQSV